MSKFNFYAFTNDFEDFELPDRNSPKYTEIDNFGDYELSNNVAYELASRNIDVQNELISFASHGEYINDLMTESIKSNTDLMPKSKVFDYKKFFEYGFDELSIRYLCYRKEAKNYKATENYSHDALHIFCKSYIDALGYNFDHSPYVILLKKYVMVEDYLNHDFFQRMSCNYIKKDNEILSVGFFDGSYYDENSDNPYNLTETSKDNYIFKKGIYTYKDDPFDIEPLPLEYESYDEILPTISLNYCRPIMKNPYMNKHIYVHLNLNLEEDEILSNVKKMIKINNSKDDTSLKQKILDASDLFFEKYKSYKKPKNIRKNELQTYYSNMLYVYDTFKLFDKYLIKVDEKYNKGMEAIKSQNNKDVTDGRDRDNQRKELKAWKNEKRRLKPLDDQIYYVLFGDEELPSDGSHEVNTLKGLAKKLIDDKQYRFLI